MNTLVSCIFGSHLYGLNTETSDKDYKEVFIPDLKQVLLHGTNMNQNISTKSGSDTKNTADDVDTEKFSLGTFIQHLVNSEMIAIDMVHSEPRHWLNHDPLWTYVVSQREKFYTRGMRSYLGYIKKQVAKYSFKGSRLNIISNVIQELNKGMTGMTVEQLSGKGPRLKDVIGSITIGDHVNHVTSEGPNHIEINFLEVFGSKYMHQDYVYNVRSSLQMFLDGYGKRAKLAADNEGVDWKAVSHAFRACYQAKAIFLDGGFKYPLPQNAEILAVKKGELDYKKEVEPRLEALHNEVIKLSEVSKLPERVDPKIIEDIQLNIYAYYYPSQMREIEKLITVGFLKTYG